MSALKFINDRRDREKTNVVNHVASVAYGVESQIVKMKSNNTET